MNQVQDVVARFRDLLGAEAVVTGDAAHAFTVDDQTPNCALFPASIDELSRCAAMTDAAALAMIPVGNGVQLGVGRRPQQYDIAISTRRIRRILAHEAADMTVTVEAGLTLGELNAVLIRRGQRLPLDPPHPEHTTIGALIATDACGPLRLSQGKVRDLLIGIKVVLANGTIVKGGGRVVKNVAGYDLMKLFTGSFGTLGIVVEATFKVRPCPEHDALFVIPLANTEAAVGFAHELLVAPLAPLSVEVLNRAAAVCVGVDGAAVIVGCGGSAHEIAVQRERLEPLARGSGMRTFSDADAAPLSAAVRDFPAAGNAHGCRVSLLPSKLGEVLPRMEQEAIRCGLDAACVVHAGSGVASIRFQGAPAVNGAFPPFAEWLRARVAEKGGWVVFDALPTRLKDRIDPWPAAPPGLALMRGIKKTLDPNGRLSPGRFVGGI